MSIPASAWDAVDEEGFLLIEHLLFSGINMLTGIDQEFDMRLGSHEVPAFLGAGFWVSAAKPFEGIMIEQQGGRVLFYGLGYDRDASQGDDGEPVWMMPPSVGHITRQTQCHTSTRAWRFGIESARA